MDILQIVLSIISGICVSIPLFLKLIDVVRNAQKEKNWSAVLTIVLQLMETAERNYQNGADRKTWVMSELETMSASLNYDLTDEAKERISVFIDSVCAASKTINNKEVIEEAENLVTSIMNNNK